MCGIGGFWQEKRFEEPAVEVLRSMGDAIRHRGPDDSGTFHDSASGIGLVHRRLSILDLSAAGHQPMFSHSGRSAIVFNGEVYNYEEIKAELPSRNWKGHSDTEVMLEAVEHWGIENAVRRFVGMFAFALWDRYDRKLFLVRDRLGIKPLYYGIVRGNFVFSSELKGIKQFPGFGGELDRDALTLFMRHSYVPSPHSIYRDVYKLAPGCILSIESPDESPLIRSYWSAPRVAENGLKDRISAGDDTLIERLDCELKRAVRSRMIADVPLGAFLSGGIDSSTVVAMMQVQSSRPVKTFTIGFDETEFNEASHAKAVASHLGTDHTELYLRPQELLDVVPQLSSMYDEPFADSSQIPTFLVSKLARQSVTVSLSGDGGDELFAGYNRYSLTRSIWNSLRRVPVSLRKSIANIICSIPPSRIDTLYNLFTAIVPGGKGWSCVGDKSHKLAAFFPLDSPEAIYYQALSLWTEPTKVVLNAEEPLTVRNFASESSWLPSFEEVMMLTDSVNYLPDDILTKVDRASMAVSLEARVPLLDHQLFEFAWKLPLRFKLRDGKSKWILRQVLFRYVPEALLERPKMGFGVPVAEWLRGPLREWAEDLISLDLLREQGILNHGIIRQYWSEHISGKRNWHYQLWNVLVFQDWYQHSSQALETV